jgi:RNA polymerase sigma-70 factor (ECF subfamily)
MTLPTPSIESLRSGDPQALSALFEIHADRVYRLAFGLLRERQAAEDVVQETFLSAMTHLHQFEGRSSLGTWLYRVAYNASLTRLREKPTDTLPPDEPEAGEPPLPRALIEWDLTPEEMLMDGEAHRHLDAAIARLPEALRAAFLVRDVEGLSTLEAAETLGISEGAVKVRLHRARLMLREHLAEYFGERAARKEGEK